MNQQNLQDNFSAEKLELLAYLLEEEGIEVSATETIPPRKTNDNLPLSYAQQRLWFLQQLEPNSPFYNIPSALRLQGYLNVTILESCFNQIIQRHEILRTKFTSIDGQPRQIITPELNITLPVIDLSNLPVKEKETEARRLINLEAQTPFNLEIPPLLRTSLLRLNEAEYILLFTMHHIVSDGWSTDILVGEVVTLYESLINHQPSTLPELTIQYADYATWQRQWLQGEVLNKQLNFWQQQLADIPSILPLPLDKPRPHIQSYRGTKQTFVISPELTNALKNLSQQENCTLFMILLAAFKVLLYRYTATEDIVVGSPVANRNRTEVEALIGFFVNTLVLRTNLSDHPSFLAVLARVKECTLSAYANQDVPFDLIIESVKSDRSLSHTPLFQVMFVLQNAPQSNMELPDLTWESLEIEATTTKFDLSLLIEETATELKACWEYSTDLFNPDTISRLSEHFQTLLSSIVANPEQSITQLPLLTAKEQQQLLVEWNATQADYALDKSIHQLFAEQVVKSPDAVAVVFEDSQLTYRELNSQANQLAHYLQENGVKPEIIVGICCDRSLAMVIALLAVLKAGGAYLPLDPSYPPERLRFMVEDSNLAVLLTQTKLLDLVSNSQAKIICLDREKDKIAQNSAINPVNSVTPENLAYVIYTSGSTGKPKGVMIPHRALTNHMLWMQTELPLDSADKVLQKTPFSFDASVWEFYAPLLVGGRLIVAKPDGHQDPSYLTELIIQEKISILQLVPSMLRVLLEEEIDNCKSLRRVFCGGENLPGELQQRFYRQFEHCELYNLYGPTEATIDTTYYLCPRQTEPINSIGKPISNVQVYILDADLQPVPIGIPGEIYIGGAGLAQGYINQPELTVEKFIENPCLRVSSFEDKPQEYNVTNNNYLPVPQSPSPLVSPSPYSLLYKTGDKARYLPDGNIEFLGRIDHQVKLRGFRIELGEIEIKLEQHPQIKQAVVEVREDDNRQRLIAYLIGANNISLTSKELRSYLQDRLPEYMIPGIFVFLEAFPLTPNGKIDRHALPIPKITSDRELSATPRNQIESTLVNIWQEVLQVDNLGIHDNFFELGGDSIMSLQVIAKARSADIQLTPKQIFQYQTIADLGTVANTTNTTTTQSAEQGLATGIIPLTPIQQRFFAQQFTDSHHWNQSVILEVNDCNPKLLEQAIQHLWEHHDVLRSRFVESDSGWQGEISGVNGNALIYNYQLSELSQDQQKQKIEAIASELQASFNLSQGQLIKIVWFDLGKQQSSRLLIIAHHLVIDGVSWRILLEDLETAYQQLSQGETVKLPAKTTSYKYWAEQLQTYAQSETAIAELDYWLNLLQGTDNRDKLKILPVDFPRGENTVAAEVTLSVSLTKEETQTLLSEVPSAYQTQINDVLLTALAQAFQAWTNSNSLLIELEGHGREDILDNIDLSRTVGWFTTIFPILLDLGNNSHPGESLKTIKEQLRSIPQRGINYGVLRYLSHDASIRKKLENLPQAAVRFNYLGQIDQIINKSALFQPAKESTGNNQSLRGHRDCGIEINSAIANGQLFLDWTYSQELYRETTMQQLAEGFIEKLRSLICHCQSPNSGGYTPSDFPQMEFDAAELDVLLSELDS